jgi:hypothetical protein
VGAPSTGRGLKLTGPLASRVIRAPTGKALDIDAIRRSSRALPKSFTIGRTEQCTFRERFDEKKGEVGRGFSSQDEPAARFGRWKSTLSEWLKEWTNEGLIPKRRKRERCKAVGAWGDDIRSAGFIRAKRKG